MLQVIHKLKRVTWGVSAAALAATGALPLLVGMGSASAAQLSSRSITMSSSKPSATSVTYTVKLTPTDTTATAVVIDFCSNNPIINTSCTATAGTDVPNLSGVGTVAGWTKDVSTASRIKLSAGTLSAGVNTITIPGVTNPSNTGTFYARVTTYTTANLSSYTGPTSVGTYSDYGAAALSTAAVVTVTAIVQEQLTFCVFNSSCGDTPAVNLGTGNPAVISSSTPSYGQVKFSVATNAVNGATVALLGSTADLTSGGNSITAIGSTKAGITAGKFGQTVKTPGTSFTAASPYNTTTQYARPATINATPSSLGTEAVSDTDTTTLEYGVQASATTPSGVYTVNDQLIATGTF